MLYHGTSENLLQSIRTKGLTPRGSANGNWKRNGGVGSVSEFVYLANAELTADLYSAKACAVNNCSTCTTVVLRQEDLNEDNFYPDENCFAERDGDGFISTVAMIKAKQEIESHKDKWRKSLELQRTLCHKGPIDASKIVEVKNYDVKENPWFFLIPNFELFFQSFITFRTRHRVELTASVLRAATVIENDYQLLMTIGNITQKFNTEEWYRNKERNDNFS